MDYLLSDAHPDGRGKARFFKKFGFDAGQWERLARALKEHANTCEAVKRVESVYGSRYAVEGPLVAPDGRRPMVRTIWLCERGREEPRLITAYPLEDLQ